MQKINNNDSEVTSPQSYTSSSPTNNNNTNNYPPVPEGMPPEYGSPRSPRSRTQSSASSVSDFGRRYANGMSVSSMSSMSSKNTQNRDTVNSQKSNKPPDAAVNFASLDSLMADLGDMIDKKASGSASSSPKQTQVQTFPYAEVEKVKSDYELRVANLQKRIKELENELSTKEAGTDDDSARVKELEKQLEEQKQINKKQTTKMTELEREFDKLTEDHHQQQEVANDVQKEATGLLEEIKEISKRNEELCAEKEEDAAKIKSLTGEINDWKNKYEKIRTELRNLKATSSFYKEAPKVDIVKDNSLAPTPDGGIEESRIVSYQVAIDDLLRSGRSDDPTNVLMAMKSIVIACKSITEEVDNYEQRKSAYMNAEDKSNLDACKARLSVTLKNLMTSAKNHATGYGISPVSLLDASAGHLTATIVDLVKAVKLRRERGQNNNLNPDSYPFKIPSEPLPTNNFSSEIAPLRTKNSQNEMNSGSDNQVNGVKAVDIDELKDFLERQTEAIVHAIHTLLQAIRGGATYSTSNDLTDNINTITSIVLTVIKVCQDSFKSSAGAIYRTRGDIILKELENNVDKLEEMNDLIAKDSTDFMSNKTSKQRLAGASFEIAKFTKELVGLVKKDD
ncbi:Spa2p [Rhizophagus irregularis DAOM 197198w]|nr:Spa2p [Rhizophagus irregularis DAOM 197198w]